jgi:hypothetical protein
MHLQQRVAQLLQHAHAGGLVVHEGAAATVGAQRAAQHQVLVAGVGQPLGLEQLPHRMVGRGREHRRGDRLRRAPAHQPGVRALAGGEAQRIQDDGLARAGFAGERGEARADGEVQRLDQHDVADLQPDQHRADLGRESGDE